MRQQCPRLVLVWVLWEVVVRDEAPNMDRVSSKISRLGRSLLNIVSAVRGLCCVRCLADRLCHGHGGTGPG